ncbi:MAG: family 78 glycoside hydrolase catalytic domain, partial [Clostridia bacterium]|nr:family 78 glycoside hydrolase catalytic domain [Clostridia bacterium]
MRAIHLRTEYLENPVGLGNPAPRFFWTCEGGVTQTAYRIVCLRAHDGKTVWDSGKIPSSRMTHIRYEGEKLKSRDRGVWTVTLWDENGEPGEPVSAFFELGLLDPADFKASWIAGDYRPKKNARYPVDCFRKTFSVPGKIKKARLYAAARGLYDVTINGTRLEDFLFAPGMTDYRKRIQVQTYDVTALLREDNTVELRLADGWFRGSVAAYGVTNVFGTQTSVLAQLEITTEDGSVTVIPTDGTWSWSNDGEIRFADLKDGEIVDASMKPSYAGKAKVVPPPKGVLLCPSDNVPVQAHERFRAARLRNRVLDFGQNLAGILAFTVHGQKGQKIRIVCGEVLDGDGNVDLSGIRETRPAKGWTRGALIKKLLTNKVSGVPDFTPKQEIVFTCSGGEDRYRMSFAVFGFRYAQLDTDIDIDAEAVAVYSSMEETGAFSCSNELVNRLASNTLWSMKSNFLDVPTDCPTRERLGWTGDAQIFFDTGAYLMNTAPFFAKWLRDMADAQYPDGLLPAVLPYSGVEMMYKATGSSVGWADAVYLIPYRFYKRFGDWEILRESWPMIRKYAEYLKKNVEKDGHYEKGVHLGEWLEPEKFRDKVYGAREKHSEECTAYLYLAMTTIAEIAEILGDPGYAETLRPIAERAKQAYAE